jgi:large subunit ribosomal protein L4
MATLKVYRYDGRAAGDLKVKQGVFDAQPSTDAVYRFHLTRLANLRQGTASTKTRGLVSGGGAKPHRQKGTGRARAGSRRSPLHRHGGTVFGPQPKEIEAHLPRKVKRLALATVLSARAADDRVRVVDEFPIETPKTRDVVAFLARHEIEGRALLVTEKVHPVLVKSAANLRRVTVRFTGDLCADDVLASDHIVLTKNAVRALEERLCK